MKGTLTSAQQKKFCRAFFATMDPQRAAAAIGQEDGFALLRSAAIREQMETMRGELTAQITREDALRRLTELAFGRANDALALALSPPGERTNLDELDLSAVTEFKVTDKGVEVKLLDRIRALEALCELLSGDSGGAEEFFRALEDAGGEESGA